MDSFAKAFKCLRAGRVILLQTDTLWGVSADSTYCSAVRKLFDVKKRPAGRPMLSLASGFGMVGQYARIPFPLDGFEGISLVLDAREGTGYCPLLIRNGKLCMRVPVSPRLRRFVERYGRPIASTSANVSGHRPPLSYSEVPRAILDECCAVIENPDWQGVLEPSTVVDLTYPKPRIIRKGFMWEKVERLIKERFEK